VQASARRRPQGAIPRCALNPVMLLPVAPVRKIIQSKVEQREPFRGSAAVGQPRETAVYGRNTTRLRAFERNSGNE